MLKKKNKTSIQSRKSVSLRDKVYGAMLLIVVAIMPLVVRHTVTRAAPELIDMLVFEFYQDFFAFYKGWVLGIPAVVIAFYAVSDWLIGGFTKSKFSELIKSPPIAAACVFLFMALVSTIFSSYQHTSWLGAVHRFEGIFILFAYFIVFFAAMHYAATDKHVKLIMYGLVFSSIIMGLVGLGQFIGRDFFATRLAARLVMGNWDAVLNPQFQIANGTLYNPNTFGKYTAMVAPILMACALVYDGRKWMRAVFLAGGVLMLIGVMGSGSVGGLIGIATAVTVTLVTFICRFFYQKRQRKEDSLDTQVKPRNITTLLIGGAVLVALVSGLLFVPAVNQRLNFLLGRLEYAARRESTPIYDYIFEGDRLTVFRQDSKKYTLVLLDEVYGPDRVLWRIYDVYGQPVPLVSRIVPAAPENEDEPVSPLVNFAYDILGYGRLYLHTWEEHNRAIIPAMYSHSGLEITLHRGRIHAIASNGNLIDLAVPIPSIGFEGNETWGSNRGHIWSRTFPLMPARAIIGSGPDTYTLVFPQHDVIGKMRSHGSPYITLDKAHNLYLQTWITTGGVSALALIFLFVYYLFTSFVSIVRSRMKEGVFIFGLRFGLLAGISAFCIAAMATDSTTGSSGVFYLLLGLGYGVNYMIGRVYSAEEEC